MSSIWFILLYIEPANHINGNLYSHVVSSDFWWPWTYRLGLDLHRLPDHHPRYLRCCGSLTPSTECVLNLSLTFATCWEWNHTQQLDTPAQCFLAFLARWRWRYYQTWWHSVESRVWRHDCGPEICARFGRCWCWDAEQIYPLHQHMGCPQLGRQCP